MKRDQAPGKQAAKPAGIGVRFVGLILLSGFAALIYQVLWMRELGLVLGSSAQAAALTLGVFFAGLAAGSAFWGRRAASMERPLRAYGHLELGMAAAGLLCLVLPPFYRFLMPWLHAHLPVAGLWLAKGLLACGLVLPSSLLMGGTLPVLARRLIGDPRRLGAAGALLYGCNTLGAALGAFSAAFLFLAYFGFRWTCLLAVGVSALVGLLALHMAKAEGPMTVEEPPSDPGETGPARQDAVPRRLISALAFLSGFNVLALEVAWTRMFAQVHENSVYSFAVVLMVVLLSLAAGSWLAARLAARDLPARPTLLALCVLGGFATAIVPAWFARLTGGLRMLPEPGSFALYVLQLLGTALAAIAPTCVLLGILFPFLMKAEERHAQQASRSVGRLAALNTLGAILGSLVCGFVLLEALGLWRTMQVIAVGYLVLALCLPARGSLMGGPLKALAAVLLLLTVGLMRPDRLPIIALNPANGPQQVVEHWEASDGAVTVLRNEAGHHSIHVNSNYSLGSSEAYMPQIYQSRVPLLAYPDTSSVFYLGMGTGMTAGEALDRNDFRKVSQVVVCELSPRVVTASHRYFTGRDGAPDYTNGLFNDPRAKVIIADGRNQLLIDPARYDMINADLFLPYRSGAGSLYSLEHFRTVRERLNPGGVFVQWLPLYQLTERDFGIIARTMLEAFGQVTLWRNHFQPGAEMVALVGHRDPGALPSCALDSSALQRQTLEGATHLDTARLQLPVNPQTIPFFYCGNLTGSAGRFAAYPLNTDDHPLIEYGSPRTLRRQLDGTRPHMVGARLADLVDALLAATPPAEDPLLASRSEALRRLPLAGAAFHRTWIAMVEGDEAAWRRHWKAFAEQWNAAADDRRSEARGQRPEAGRSGTEE